MILFPCFSLKHTQIYMYSLKSLRMKAYFPFKVSQIEIFAKGLFEELSSSCYKVALIFSTTIAE